MTDYFSCIKGICEKCSKNPHSFFRCDSYGECSCCVAQCTDFCEVCAYFKESISTKKADELHLDR